LELSVFLAPPHVSATAAGGFWPLLMLENGRSGVAFHDSGA
jgi:hypothetical protein